MIDLTLWQSIILGYLSVGVILSCYVFFTLSQVSDEFLKNNIEYLEGDDVESYLKVKKDFDERNKYLLFFYYTLVSPIYVISLGVLGFIRLLRGK